MFNSLSIRVAESIAVYMGLDRTNARELSAILEACRGVWRLPQNAIAPTFKRTKGIPQGMATSVAMAEMSVVCFLWRLHAATRVTTIVYVDDINLISDDLLAVEPSSSPNPGVG